MSDLTPERRAELRAYHEHPNLADTHALIERRVILALLDAGDERDRLAAAGERVRALHKPGDLMAWSEDCDDPEGHQWIDDPHGGGMLCADEISGAYCMGCVPDETVDMSDYPHPCLTLRALDGTDE